MVSYTKLWRLLRKRGLLPKDLCVIAGLSASTVRALQKNQYVRMDVLERICDALIVDIGDICSFRVYGRSE